MVVLAGFLYALVVTIIGVTFPVGRRDPDNRNIRNMWKLSSFSLLLGGGVVYF